MQLLTRLYGDFVLALFSMGVILGPQISQSESTRLCLWCYGVSTWSKYVEARACSEDCLIDSEDDLN